MLNDETRVLRRWFHAHPESSLKEYKTSQKIKEVLDKLGIQYQGAGETGVVGVIKGTAPGADEGRVIGLRADIDALEIQEENDVPYKSVNDGLMHACGHDAHTAALLGAAKILQQDKAHIPGTVKLIFEPAEEIGRGADIIIKSGLVDDVKAFFGIHVTPRLKTGQVSLVSGPIMAGANSLIIEVTGKSGHGAQPDQAVDAIFAGSAIVQSLQEIVSRETDPVEPAVVTVGTFYSGTRSNIIANKAVLTGTVRVITEKSRTKVAKAVKRVVAAVADAFRVKASVECEYVTPIVINDEKLCGIAEDSVKALISEKAIVRLPIEMGTDDFAVFSTIAPAFYAKAGIAHGKVYPLHHERFDIDEESLEVLSGLFVEFVNQYFKKMPGSRSQVVIF